ncbi:MAG TPA: methionine ABC transporter permease [Clostridium sp.]
MSSDLVGLLVKGTIETLYMVSISTVIALSIGLILGIILVVTGKGGIYPLPIFSKILGTLINVVRSFPGMILIIILLPVARAIVGTSLGTNAAIVSISIGTAPFIARVVESSLKEIGYGKIEAAESMGASPVQIVTKVLIPETLPSIIRGVTLSIITIISFTALAGAIGAGGVGSLAIRYGYERFRTDVLIGTVIILIVLVQFVQLSGDFIARQINKKRFNFE